MKRAITPQVRTIQILVHTNDPQYRTPAYDVFDGERYVDRMNWDEMLGVVARLTHPKLEGERDQYGMTDAQGWQDRAERLRKHRERAK